MRIKRVGDTTAALNLPPAVKAAMIDQPKVVEPGVVSEVEVPVPDVAPVPMGLPEQQPPAVSEMAVQAQEAMNAHVKYAFHGLLVEAEADKVTVQVGSDDSLPKLKYAVMRTIKAQNGMELLVVVAPVQLEQPAEGEPPPATVAPDVESTLESLADEGESK